jgi:hypothetical protein
MFDTITESAWPSDPQAVLGYVDGHVGDQPDWAYVQHRFPNAFHLSIALDPAHDAMALDIETGAASPSSAVAWYERQKARGVARPCLYASASLMEATIIPVVRAARFPRDQVRLWSAHYTHSAHICGPSSCGLTSVAVDGTQWTDRAYGRNLDQSLLLGDFFGAAPKPPPGHPSPWPAGTVLREGDSGAAVRALQTALSDSGIRGVRGITVDSVFGQQTLTAVRNFQADKGLAVDGIAGPQVRAALGIR